MLKKFFKKKSIKQNPPKMAPAQRPWQPQGIFKKRCYESYQEYVEHQKTKLNRLLKNPKLGDLSKYDVEYRQTLRERLEGLTFLQHHPNVLCLAARLGTEVKAFIDIGCFAVGIDLNPGPENHYVIVGDFHQLQFADHSIDAVFTNSLDHAFDLQKIIGEIHRVLKPGGRFIAEIYRGTSEGCQPREFESLSWENTDDIVSQVSVLGLRISQQTDFEKPWPGRLVVFEKHSLP
jgi:SAM-dependent methyltransferase